MTVPVLPVYYYLDHFVEMLAFVRETYGSVLDEEHRAFFARFETLSRDAKCLLVRMINRRGRIFDHRTFSYAEIGDIERATLDLVSCGHARAVNAEDYADFLACLPKSALIEGAKSAGRQDVRTSWAKPKLIEFFLAQISFSTAFARCGGGHFIALDNTRLIAFLLYLYFGKTEDDLKNFALRDLGILRTNKETTSFSARFADADEARACFYYSELLDRMALPSAAAYQQAASEVFCGPPCTTDYAADIASRTACQAGMFFEKQGDGALAERLYRFGSSAECHERLVRLVYKNGDKPAAEALLRQMIDDPASDEEFVFATDFYGRKFGGRRTTLYTELLRSGRTIVVDDAFRGSPEAGVGSVLRRQGSIVFFCENMLWRSLFGLLFWDELFESNQLHSSFDRLPHCLKDRSFMRLFSPTIETKLAAVEAGSAMPLILRSIASKWGRPNGVFAWHHVKVDAIRALITGASPEGIAAILRQICEDFPSMRDGFPDLMLAGEGRASFLEIKAEGDAIRRNQLTRLRQLQAAGIPAEIGRVEYRFDPDQDYVVLDVETTGGRVAAERITEIGAVKIRNRSSIPNVRFLRTLLGLPASPTPWSARRLFLARSPIVCSISWAMASSPRTTSILTMASWLPSSSASNAAFALPSYAPALACGAPIRATGRTASAISVTPTG
jgi:DNA polymerase III subunit epsilon